MRVHGSCRGGYFGEAACLSSLLSLWGIGRPSRFNAPAKDNEGGRAGLAMLMQESGRVGVCRGKGIKCGHIMNIDSQP